MEILHVGIFKDHDLGGDIIFEKGFKRNNCDVERFDYREIARLYGVEKMQEFLLQKSQNKDLVFIGKGELIKPETLEKIRKKRIIISLWYGDIRPKIEPWLLNNLKYIDYFFMSSGGDILKEYSKNGKPKFSINYFNPSDPEIVEKYKYKYNKKKYDLVFTGSYYSFFSKERYQVISYLKKLKNIRFFGYNDYENIIRKIMYKMNIGKYKQRVRGKKYIEVIKKTKIGIGVSAYNNIPFYTSDRLTHYLSFGTFFLPHYFPGLEILFKNIKYYNSLEELKEKIEYYLRNEDEREELAKKCQKEILEKYNTIKMTKMFLEVIRSNTQNIYEWVKIIKI
ncbi:hypothetical protein X275_00665 [Marinitoga sp. 1197]|uniref:glycosyltransferase family protein n=1 Tax=Marinitoga sp. 1197 TaxID=1428449 RepID=UPI0006413C0D|nr:glycosyltransferase [Marinitoga sp. 1197]KLO24343.1 hypothetical protein X275_00665 [Marinitoga sp. 1197]